MLSLPSTTSVLPVFAAAAALTLLAACAGDRGAGSASAGMSAASPLPAMDGRWVFSSATGGKCNMNFGGGTGEGTIAPEGGCPDRFFTSRKWTFEQGALVIRDHNGRPLAQLAVSAPDRFEGQAAAGPGVTLTR
jgi:hypothetical protein